MPPKKALSEMLPSFVSKEVMHSCLFCSSKGDILAVSSLLKGITAICDLCSLLFSSHPVTFLLTVDFSDVLSEPE